MMKNSFRRWPLSGVINGCMALAFVITLEPQLTLGNNFRVIDGDTIKTGNEVIRLRGFDTPETRFAKCEAELRLGRIAKRRLETLLRNGKVRITRGTHRDKYGRTLGRLYVDGVDVAQLMISEEFARPYYGGRRKSWCEPLHRRH